MKDDKKTKEQLIQELEDLRRRITELEKTETDCKRAEEALRESEERYRGLFEHISSCVAIYEAVDDGADFVFKDINGAGERVEDIARDQVIGKRVTKIFPGVTNFGILDVFRKVWQTGEPLHHPVTFYQDQRIQGWRENYIYRLPSGEIVVVYEDITDRKRAEAQLRESELRLSQTIEFLPDATFAIDAQGRVIIWNRAMEDLTGIPAAKMLGRGDYDYAVPFYGKPRPVLIDLTLASDQEISRSYIFFQKSDRRLVSETYIADFQGRGSTWLWNIASTLYGSHGQVMGAIESIRDITEHKRNEEELKRANSLLNAALESTADGLLVVTMEGKVASFNRKFLELWRIPENLVAQRDDQALLQFVLDQLKAPAAFLDRVMELYQSPEASSFDELEFRDGRVFERYSQPQYLEGLVVGRVWSFRDVTDRRQAEERVKEQRRLQDAILDSIPAPVFYKDNQGKYLGCNRAFLEFLGLSKNQVIGKAVFEVVSHEVAETFYRADQNLFRERDAQVYETRIPDADGRIHDVIFHKAIFTDKEGVDAGIVGVMIDVTARKRAEEALKTLSIRDDLTGLFNRRGFITMAEQGLKTAQRMGTEMLLIFGDLDNLKGINDSFGHNEGDQALVDTSRILKDTFRESDIIARIGGDEFVILAMNSLETSAEKLISRFEQVLNDHHPKTERSYNLSMSLGIACFDPKNPCSIDVLIAQGDKLMYENKQKKRRPV